MSCADAIGHLPSARALLAINIAIFGAALIVAIVAVSIWHRTEYRRRLGDPYARPFGDDPGVIHMRAYRPRR